MAAWRVFLAGEQGAELGQHEAEDFLVAAAFDQGVERAGYHAAGAGAAQDSWNDAGDQAAGSAIFDR